MVLNIVLFINFMLTGLSFAAEHQNHPRWVSVPATTITSHPPLPPPGPHGDVAEATTVDDGHKTATDKVRQERRAGRTGNDDESRGRGDGLHSPSPKNRTFAFQISPILLTKGRFHHRTQRLAASPPISTQNLRW